MITMVSAEVMTSGHVGGGRGVKKRKRMRKPFANLAEGLALANPFFSSLPGKHAVPSVSTRARAAEWYSEGGMAEKKHRPHPRRTSSPTAAGSLAARCPAANPPAADMGKRGPAAGVSSRVAGYSFVGVAQPRRLVGRPQGKRTSCVSMLGKKFKHLYGI